MKNAYPFNLGDITKNVFTTKNIYTY